MCAQRQINVSFITSFKICSFLNWSGTCNIHIIHTRSCEMKIQNSTVLTRFDVFVVSGLSRPPVLPPRRGHLQQACGPYIHGGCNQILDTWIHRDYRELGKVSIKLTDLFAALLHSSEAVIHILGQTTSCYVCVLWLRSSLWFLGDD